MSMTRRTCAYRVGLQVLTQTQMNPEGLLNISAPVVLGQQTFYAFLSAFLKSYPRIQADLFITNLFLDLIAENIDVAIRFGELQDSSLIAQRIGKSVRYVVAVPEYLHGRIPPSRPEDLRQHQCVILHGRNNEAEWHLVSGKKSIKFHVSGPVAARDFQAAERFHLSGSRHWPAAIDLLRCSDREWRTRQAAS